MARTGRPRAFNREQALNRAMLLFWEQGFEATSLDQLKRAMGGLSSASFYAAFGAKEALYREALQLYLATHGKVTAPLYDLSLPPREAVERALRGSATMQTDPSHPAGCMVALSAGVSSEATAALRPLFAAEREANRDALRGNVERAIAAGELCEGTRPEALAAMLEGVLLGLSAQARDGVSASMLNEGISYALVAWDAQRADVRRGTGNVR